MTAKQRQCPEPGFETKNEINKRTIPATEHPQVQLLPLPSPAFLTPWQGRASFRISGITTKAHKASKQKSWIQNPNSSDSILGFYQLCQALDFDLQNTNSNILARHTKSPFIWWSFSPFCITLTHTILSLVSSNSFLSPNVNTFAFLGIGCLCLLMTTSLSYRSHFKCSLFSAEFSDPSVGLRSPAFKLPQWAVHPFSKVTVNYFNELPAGRDKSFNSASPARHFKDVLLNA